MENTGISLVTLVLLLPLVGFFLILLFQREEQAERIKWTAFVTSIVTFVASLLLWIGFDTTQPGLQFITHWTWLPDYGISYSVGVDGLSLLMVILTTFIMPLAILSSFRAHIFHERGREKLYYLFMLLLEFAMIGVFIAQDLFLFYIFWEVTLVPMYFLIGIWGAEERIYAAVKFFLYTMAGSILMLLAILYVGTQAQTFSVPDIIAKVQANPDLFPFAGLFSTQAFLFLGFLIAFAI
ncbi:MAG: Fe-S-binding domain-containing protein, partial [Anaerolineae bacterium]|nr:Fe-S-binding domain-containing protein [Anaerolineae bacterium]